MDSVQWRNTPRVYQFCTVALIPSPFLGEGEPDSKSLSFWERNLGGGLKNWDVPRPQMLIDAILNLS